MLNQQGALTAAVAAGTGTSTQVISTSAGYLAGILIVAAGTAAITFYDNATTASGKVIGITPATTAQGAIYQFNMPVQFGITASLVSGSPAVTVSYS